MRWDGRILYVISSPILGHTPQAWMMGERIILGKGIHGEVRACRSSQRGGPVMEVQDEISIVLSHSPEGAWILGSGFSPSLTILLHKVEVLMGLGCVPTLNSYLPVPTFEFMLWPQKPGILWVCRVGFASLLGQVCRGQTRMLLCMEQSYRGCCLWRAYLELGCEGWSVYIRGRLVPCRIYLQRRGKGGRVECWDRHSPFLHINAEL